MEKKKKSFWSQLKDKLSKKKERPVDEETEEEFEGDEYEEDTGEYDYDQEEDQTPSKKLSSEETAPQAPSFPPPPPSEDEEGPQVEEVTASSNIDEKDEKDEKEPIEEGEQTEEVGEVEEEIEEEPIEETQNEEPAEKHIEAPAPRHGIKAPSLRLKDMGQKLRKFLPLFQSKNYTKIFFSPTNRKFLHKSFQFFFTLSICYTLGKTGALIIKKAFPTKIKKVSSGVVRKKQVSVNLNAISSNNLFNVEMKKKKKEVVAKKKKVKKIQKVLNCSEATVKSSLPIKLINTIVLQNSKKSLATVRIPGKKKIQSIREGFEIKNIGKLGKIKRLRIIVLNKKKNRCEYIENRDKRFEKKFKKKKIKVLSKSAGKKALNKKKKGITSVGNNFKIKKSVRDNALKNIQNVLTQARAIQIKNPDGSLSFKMTDVVPGSIYSQLDISNGDIISEINGKKIENINEILTLFGKIKDIDNLSLTILKDGQKQEKDYEFY